jgi:hypothetical protein
MANQFVIAGGSILRWNIASMTPCSSVAAHSLRCATTPGTCPGSGWQLCAVAGSDGEDGATGPRRERGERGSIGPRGDAGASGATIVGWKIDRERYVATPAMSDGRDGPPLELRGLFEQFLLEAR